MQLIVTVPNENVMSKVIKSLKAFQNDGVEVTIDVKSDTYKMLEQIYEETKDEFLKMQLEHLPKNFEYKEKKRILHPFKIANLSGYWYLIAFDLKNNKLKSFLLNKIKNIIKSMISTLHNVFICESKSDCSILL